MPYRAPPATRNSIPVIGTSGSPPGLPGGCALPENVSVSKKMQTMERKFTALLIFYYSSTYLISIYI